MTTHTPGPWEWWTSNSWRRLRHTDRGVSTDVLIPFALKDGGADIDVTPADMALIAAAPDLLEALGDLIEDVEKQMANPSHHMPYSLPKAKSAIAKAENLT